MGILWWKGCLGSKDTTQQGIEGSLGSNDTTTRQDLTGLDLHIGSFTLREIEAATNNFHPDNKIGEGGFARVYKGFLLHGTIIAVKQFSVDSIREFVNEIGMISALRHPHIIKLHGCCIEGNQPSIVYEYMENNSLSRALFSGHQLKLDWPIRHKICIGIARGLAYLHEESRLKIVHRGINASGVLLDKNLQPKISSFGLAMLDEEDNTHSSTLIAGTYGYIAPEYGMLGYFTNKADVYGFGILLLEIVSGRSVLSFMTKAEEYTSITDLANSLKIQGRLMELVDPRLGSNFNEKAVITTIDVALHCTNTVAAERPSMSAVASTLEGKLEAINES